MLPFRCSQSCTRLQCHLIQSHIGRVYACLAVTCHLHFWQNDRDLLRATAVMVTRGWNGYRNQSQHRKLILENKILPPVLHGFEPATFLSRVRRTNHWAIPCVWLSSTFVVHEWTMVIYQAEFKNSDGRDWRRPMLKNAGRCVTVHVACSLYWVLSPYLIGRMFLREPSWKYSAKLVGS